MDRYCPRRMRCHWLAAALGIAASVFVLPNGAAAEELRRGIPVQPQVALNSETFANALGAASSKRPRHAREIVKAKSSERKTITRLAIGGGSYICSPSGFGQTSRCYKN